MKLIRTLSRTEDVERHVISEDRGTGVLRRLAEFTPEPDAGPIADRLTVAFNATEDIPLMRLVGFANPNAKVKLRECVACLDLLINTNPQLLERLLNRVRGRG